MNILNKHFGVVYGTHPGSKNCAVALFAAQVVSKDNGTKKNGKPSDDSRLKAIKDMDWENFTKEVFKMQNKMRMKPSSFIPQLEKSMNRFIGNILKTADGCSAIETEEGPMAYIEAIEYLRVQKPVPPLMFSKELELAAKDHGQDIGKTG